MYPSNSYGTGMEASRTLDVVVDADGEAHDRCGRREHEAASAEVAGNRCWIGIHFECCCVYTRLYRAAGADRYVGRCPKCRTPVTVRVSPDGVSTSFIRARVV